MNSIPQYQSLSPDMAIAAPSLERGAKAASDFEALLISSLLQSMEKTLGSLPGEGGMPGSDDYNYLGTEALAQALAAKGGFGIGRMILEHLPAHEGNGKAQTAGPAGAKADPKVSATLADRTR